MVEPKYDSKHYCILLSTTHVSQIELEETLAHELRHCYDFLKSIEYYTSGELPKMRDEFSNWSEFNAVYTATIHHFINSDISSTSEYDTFKDLSSYLGWKAAEETHGLITRGDGEYRVSRYLGLQRAVRDLSEKYAPSPAFQLWHLTPLTIEEYSPNCFYLSNKYCKKDHFNFHE